MRHGGDTGGAAARLPDTAPLASVASSGGVEVPLSALAADGGPLPHWHRTLPGEERSSLICFRLSRNAPNFLYRSGGPDGAPRAEVALRWGRRTGVGGARNPAACGVGRGSKRTAGEAPHHLANRSRHGAAEAQSHTLVRHGPPDPRAGRPLKLFAQTHRRRGSHSASSQTSTVSASDPAAAAPTARPTRGHPGRPPAGRSQLACPSRVVGNRAKWSLGACGAARSAWPNGGI